MAVGVLLRQPAEDVVVGRGAVVAEPGVVLRVVERVRGDDGAAVQAGRQHERVGQDPVDDGARLGLATLLELRPRLQLGVFLVELVREAAVQVLVVAVEPARVGVAAPTVALLRNRRG